MDKCSKGFYRVRRLKLPEFPYFRVLIRGLSGEYHPSMSAKQVFQVIPAGSSNKTHV